MSDVIRSVMTYNVHGCVGTDHRYDPQRIVRVIKKTDPDILGLQEVRSKTGRTPELLDLIEREYPAHHVLFLRTLTDSMGDYGNAIVSRFPVVDHIDLDLENVVHPPPSVSGNRRETSRWEARRAIFARLEINGNALWVIVTHLGVERRSRKSQSRQLLHAIDRFTRLEREPAVFMGDLNEWRISNALVRRLDRRFSRNAARRTFPSRFPVLPLDRIWMTSHVTRHETWTPRSCPARTASDHLPLCMNFALPEATPDVDHG